MFLLCLCWKFFICSLFISETYSFSMDYNVNQTDLVIKYATTINEDERRIITQNTVKIMESYKNITDRKELLEVVEDNICKKNQHHMRCFSQLNSRRAVITELQRNLDWSKEILLSSYYREISVVHYECAEDRFKMNGSAVNPPAKRWLEFLTTNNETILASMSKACLNIRDLVLKQLKSKGLGTDIFSEQNGLLIEQYNADIRCLFGENCTAEEKELIRVWYTPKVEE